jgi:hypothetical protein
MALPKTEFEQHILKILTTEPPKPEYEMWAKCEFRYLNETLIGQIVGMYWVSVRSAFVSQIDPGWHYMVELENAEQCHVRESNISAIN